jgi:hypothetical protein
VNPTAGSADDPTRQDDRPVTVAKYTRSIDAEIARARLDAVGIQAVVVGAPNPLHGVFGTEMRLAVAGHDESVAGNLIRHAFGC